MDKLRPLQDRVVIKRIDEEAKTAGGIFIPDTAKEKPLEGEVVAVGDGQVPPAEVGLRVGCAEAELAYTLLHGHPLDDRLVEGLTDRGIAERLFVTPNTVETHIRHIISKLGLPATSSDNRRVRAVLAYLRSG